MQEAQKDVINLNFILHFSTNKSGFIYDVPKKSLKRANVAKRYYYSGGIQVDERTDRQADDQMNSAISQTTYRQTERKRTKLNFSFFVFSFCLCSFFNTNSVQKTQKKKKMRSKLRWRWYAGFDLVPLVFYFYNLCKHPTYAIQEYLTFSRQHLQHLHNIRIHTYCLLRFLRVLSQPTPL
jgi:hypothetical protein